MNNPAFLRATFNAVAREYDAVRPGYPPALIEDVIALSALPPGGRCLEIGCGTGKATLPFARRGYSLLCLDIGPDLLAVAAERLQDYPNVRLRLESFEDWEPEPLPFDLVFSATAFHWVRREVAYTKTAAVLRPGGALAVIDNRHNYSQGGFFVEVQEIYRRYGRHDRDLIRQRPIEEDIRAKADEIKAAGLFAGEPGVVLRTYPWTQTYAAADYIRLINTYSDHLTMPEPDRSALYADIAGLIDRNYGGKVEKEYLSVLYLARRP